ncbi:MAG TPA: hypothetical protein VHU83_11620 [Bryobacteraceae bacterium]|jgi:hypothetical protein|nr:hypothetical protein [Bryobacteraceae bacterium]
MKKMFGFVTIFGASALLQAGPFTCLSAISMQTCQVASDLGVTATGTAALTGGPIAPTTVDAVLGFGPWDDMQGLDRFKVLAVYKVNINLQLTDSTLPSGVYAGSQLTGTFTLPGGADSWLVTPFGLTWNPQDGGNPEGAEGSLSSDHGGGSEFFYDDEALPFLMQDGLITASLSAGMIGPDCESNIGLRETILEVTTIPEPAVWPISAAFIALLTLIAFVRQQ